MKDIILLESGEKEYIYSDAKLLGSMEQLKALAHPLRIRIFEALAQQPQYPSQLAKQLGVHEQNIYYHIRHMCTLGILSVVSREEIRGTVAKKYAPTAKGFAVSVDDKWKPFKGISVQQSTQITHFLSPLVSQGKLHGTIVVGSPDPHGPLKASARDGHYAIDLGVLLGKIVALPDDFTVTLDVDIKAQKEEGKNMLVLGGPVTNMIVAAINEHLKVKFTHKAPYGLYSEKTGRKYTEDTVGLIAKIPNPWGENTSVFVIAGIRAIGTKSGVMALTRHQDIVFRTYESQKEWYRVVKGFDMDGDGKIDAIEILE